MTWPRTAVRRAPGKLFVAGEYAVVDPGNTAVLVAVDRYITVTARAASPASASGVVVSSDLAAPLRRTWHDGRLTEDGETPSPVLSAIETVGALLAEHGLPLPALDLSITSTLHTGGTKYGLGSSGAVTVATVNAVATACGLELSEQDLFRLSLLASARIDVKGSGGDLAASTFGGWIAYRCPDRAAALDLARTRGVEAALRTPWPHLAVRRLPPPAGLRLEVGWTGRPASTPALVAGLHRRSWRGSASHRAFVRTSAHIVQACIDALETGDGPGLLHQIRRARTELERLDGEVGLGIFTPALRALCDAADDQGGAGKPSGAGGGDCGIALLDALAPHDLAHVRKRWAAAGVLALPVAPALEGIPT
ncbi:phosphomevalonate kinase [Streptomyces sp. MBT97]|uniref:phosphomevalonate kinase n=1 Tax=Streptomyces sp. MBT97 TaxID=2800411 RepID=UPI00190B7C77|nr:phosphomevalonate kinase [Streptomyces sp. MBT97]MBK3636123.1 phosphomevalonate kinase [Streptomyces sp. MBT97]